MTPKHTLHLTSGAAAVVRSAGEVEDLTAAGCSAAGGDLKAASKAASMSSSSLKKEKDKKFKNSIQHKSFQSRTFFPSAALSLRLLLTQVFILISRVETLLSFIHSVHTV